MRRAGASILIVFGLLAASSPAIGAQRADLPPARGRAGDGMTNAELATLIDAYAIVQAQKALDLDEAQYGRFVTRLKRLQDTRRRGTQARNRALLELRRLTKEPGTDERALRDQLEALRAVEAENAAAIRKEQEAIDEVLNPSQQARFRLFEEQLERRKLDLLIRARERAARPAR
jgi:Spy/CpxP family protein refolding chaperone